MGVRFRILLFGAPFGKLFPERFFIFIHILKERNQVKDHLTFDLRVGCASSLVMHSRVQKGWS